MGFTKQHIIKLLSGCMATFGLWLVYAMLSVNTIRGDEFLSYLHSDPRWSYPEIIAHIHGGADNSYLHALLLRWAFATFGHTIVVQRMLSALAWLLGLCLVYGLLRKNNNPLVRYALPVLIGFSNFGFYLATDGRFYSMLFCLSAASLFVYFNRQRLPAMVSISLFVGIQLLGLCTSTNFVVFQLLFAAALVAVTFLKRSRETLVRAGIWIGGIILSAGVYFTWFRIPYFHSYFTTGFFTAVPFCLSDITSFISIPFRWLLLPHIPLFSDELDVFVFAMLVLSGVGYAIKELKETGKPDSEYVILTRLMPIGIILGLLLQLVLYVTQGYPLWESRYYAPVFLILPVALFQLLPGKFLPNTLLVYCSLCAIRLFSVEYPKIEERKQVLQYIAHRQQEISYQSKPSLFMEEVSNKQSDMFGLLGSIYVRYPETRTKLFLKCDSTLPERTAYFRRLSDWHYPLGVVFEGDTAAFYIIDTSAVKP